MTLIMMIAISMTMIGMTMIDIILIIFFKMWNKFLLIFNLF
jgi:hypothetical protein